MLTPRLVHSPLKTLDLDRRHSTEITSSFLHKRISQTQIQINVTLTCPIAHSIRNLSKLQRSLHYPGWNVEKAIKCVPDIFELSSLTLCQASLL